METMRPITYDWKEFEDWDGLASVLPTAQYTPYVLVEMPDGTQKRAKHNSAMVVYYKGDERIFVHSKYYKPVFSEQVILYAKNIVSEDEIDKIRVRIADDGSRYWIEATLKETWNFLGNDEYKPMIYIKNSFDGGWAFSMGFGAFRIACYNGVVLPKTIGEQELATMVKKIHSGKWSFTEAVEVIERGRDEIRKLLEEFIQKSQDTWIRGEWLKKIKKQMPKIILKDYAEIFAMDEVRAYDLWNVMTEVASHKANVKYREKFDRIAQEIMARVVSRRQP